MTGSGSGLKTGMTTGLGFSARRCVSVLPVLKNFPITAVRKACECAAEYDNYGTTDDASDRVCNWQEVAQAAIRGHTKALREATFAFDAAARAMANSEQGCGDDPVCATYPDCWCHRDTEIAIGAFLDALTTYGDET